MRVELTTNDGSIHVLALADLPERPRLAIRAVLRKAMLPQCLDLDELDQLNSGAATMGGLLRVALIRAVERIETDHDAGTLKLATDLVELFEQFEARIPFDAQTAFWRVWTQASPARRTDLAALRHRLGFAGEIPASDGAAG